MSVIYRMNPQSNFCSCPARVRCKHLKALDDRKLKSKWSVFKLEESRWVAARKDVAFVATDHISFWDMINGGIK